MQCLHSLPWSLFDSFLNLEFGIGRFRIPPGSVARTQPVSCANDSHAITTRPPLPKKIELGALYLVLCNSLFQSTKLKAPSTVFDKFSGGCVERATPVPIPDTEVKPLGADGTARATAWESRKPPGLNQNARERNLA